jgi:hypothetical protein
VSSRVKISIVENRVRMRMAAGEAPCHRTSDSHMPLIEDDSAPRAAEEAENRRSGPQHRGAEAGCQPHRGDIDRRRRRAAGAVGLELRFVLRRHEHHADGGAARERKARCSASSRAL